MTIKENQIEDYISTSTQSALDLKADKDWDTLTNTSVNGVSLDNTWPGTNYLSDDWSYKPLTSAPVDSVNGETWAVVLDTSDIADTTDARYVTDAEQVVIGNTSWTNTWDQSSIDALNSATTVVDVSASTAPTAWQVLTANSSTDASWQDAAWGGGGMTLLSTTTVTTWVSNIDFSSSIFTSGYKWFIIRWFIEMTSADRFITKVSSNNLSTFNSIGYVTDTVHTNWTFIWGWNAWTTDPQFTRLQTSSTVNGINFEIRTNEMGGDYYWNGSISYSSTAQAVASATFIWQSATWNSMRFTSQSGSTLSNWFISVYWITT